MKYKDLRPFVEKILTSGKNQSLHSKRKVYSVLRDDNLVRKVFGVLAKRYSSRNGGYTRILKAGFRSGDSSPMAVIELVDRDIEAKGLVDKERIKKSEDNKTNEMKTIPDNTTNKDTTKEPLEKKPAEQTKLDKEKK